MASNKLSSAMLNRILKGGHAQIWFNGQELSTAQKFELKMSGDIETLQFIGSMADYSIYNGWSGSGTLERLKTDSSIVKLIVDAFLSGVMPECEMLCLLENPSTGKRERCKVGIITFTEATIMALDKKSNINESIPFNFSDFEFLETIEY